MVPHPWFVPGSYLVRTMKSKVSQKSMGEIIKENLSKVRDKRLIGNIREY